ncbi:SMP-30/gluconolactonase/LRE family protein [Amycolatopsis sp. FDAARGOS 1241]|uniref:SMP-30/gluconolactonase/LRE family protein n=1 Tax=Amycolatopsis sp. FDAARGOS 1241 TaxID=2778070 RepID=UPI001EF31FE5|nr:hypothetical protein [Amycolatopsis sp. FDAARGOS 1241]
MSAFKGSNGITFGSDGRFYVAEFLGGRISAVELATGPVDLVVPAGGAVQSPDDLAFGPDGSMYITDLVPGRVWRRDPAGDCTLVSDSVTMPNDITCVGDRLFVNEMRVGGRLLELFPSGGGPVVLVEGLAMGNAMQLGSDRCLSTRTCSSARSSGSDRTAVNPSWSPRTWSSRSRCTSTARERFSSCRGTPRGS